MKEIIEWFDMDNSTPPSNVPLLIDPECVHCCVAYYLPDETGCLGAAWMTLEGDLLAGSAALHWAHVPKGPRHGDVLSLEVPVGFQRAAA